MKTNKLFSILAFLALIISVCVKERKKSLEIQSINCLFEALYEAYEQEAMLSEVMKF